MVVTFLAFNIAAAAIAVGADFEALAVAFAAFDLFGRSEGAIVLTTGPLETPGSMAVIAVVVVVAVVGGSDDAGGVAKAVAFFLRPARFGAGTAGGVIGTSGTSGTSGDSAPRPMERVLSPIDRLRKGGLGLTVKLSDSLAEESIEEIVRSRDCDNGWERECAGEGKPRLAQRVQLCSHLQLISSRKGVAQKVRELRCRAIPIRTDRSTLDDK